MKLFLPTLTFKKSRPRGAQVQHVHTTLLSRVLLLWTELLTSTNRYTNKEVRDIRNRPRGYHPFSPPPKSIGIWGSYAANSNSIPESSSARQGCTSTLFFCPMRRETPPDVTGVIGLSPRLPNGSLHIAGAFVCNSADPVLLLLSTFR